MSEWTTDRILASLDALDDAPLPDDVLEIRTEDYRLFRYPERFLSPTFPAAQVAWSNTSKPLDVIVDEVIVTVHDWGLDDVHWWITHATRPSDTEAVLRARGAELSDEYQILARELTADSSESPPPEGITVELVCDGPTFDAASVVEEKGWGRAPVDEKTRTDEFVRTLDHLDTWSRFRFVAFVENEPASTGQCTLNGDLARLWGAVTLPEFRGRGCYRAVLGARTHLARQHGATIAVTRGRPSTSGPLLVRAGFTVHAEERCYQLAVR